MLAHLLSCEELYSGAVYLALLLDEPIVTHVHPTRQWNPLLRYDKRPFADLLTLFTLRRRVLLQTLDGLSEAQWARPFQHAGKRSSSVYGKVRTIALHEQGHCEQIEQIRKGAD